MSTEPEWLVPASLDEALALRAERRDGATVVAGGTFVGILVNSRLMAPDAFLSLQCVAGLDYIRADEDLRIGALTTHRAVELSPVVRVGWPSLAHAFSVVASPRVRNQATVGGVLADADYASDPPSMFVALGARAVARSVRGEREVPVEELITGFYETSLEPDELLVEVVVPGGEHRAAYRKFRSRSHEDRPAVGVAACRRRASFGSSSARSPAPRSGSRSSATRTPRRRRSRAATPRRSTRSRTSAARPSIAGA